MSKQNPFLREIPQYLDSQSWYVGLAPEKQVYINFIKSLVKQIKFGAKEKIAVFGVGRGLESQVIVEVLDNREKQGEINLADIKLDSIDISHSILESLKKSACSERIKMGLVQADLLNLPRNVFPSSSYALVAMSSILHEIQSEKN